MPQDPKHPVTPGVSDVRLAMAKRAMDSAETLQELIQIKDQYKQPGHLTPKDLDRLANHFSGAQKRIKRQEHINQQRTAA
jgi:hypothetical protein